MAIVWRNRHRKIQLRRLITRYFYSGWQPATLCFCLLGLWLLSTAGTGSATVLSFACGGLGAIAFVSLIGGTIWTLFTRRWLRSAISFCLLICFCYALALTIANHFLFAADDSITDAILFQQSSTQMVKEADS